MITPLDELATEINNMITTLDELIKILEKMRDLRGGETKVFRADSAGFKMITAVNYENATYVNTGVETGVIVIGDMPE